MKVNGKKRLRIWGALSLLTIIIAAGCTSGNSTGSSTPTSNSGAAPVSSTEPAPENVELRMMWWGSQDRHDMTMKVIELFEKKNPHIKVTPEYSGWDGYWDKLSVQVSGGSAPDVVQMSFAYLADYTNRQALLDFGTQDINLDKVDEGTLSTGKLNGKLYAIPSGVGTSAMVYDKAILDKAGIQLTKTPTWEELANIATEIHAKLGGDVVGIPDLSDESDVFNYYLRTKGMSLFQDNKIGFTAETLEEYYIYWDKLRKSGGIPSVEASLAYKSEPLEKSLLMTGKSAFAVYPSNNFNAVATMANRPLEMAFIPSHTDEMANYLTPTMYWSITAKSKHPKEAAMLVDFIINDPEAGKILSVNRGVPISSEVRDIVMPQLNDNEKMMVDFVGKVSKSAKPVNIIEPNGSGEVRKLFGNIANEVGFGKKTPAQAAQEFIKSANDILDKMNK
ncbi:extracellular solute-binding protein [Paenibacillus sp. J5C_2022]|nr:extracellular solute-binding protein [Paenibacillus sp. J5C2022]